MYEDDSCLMYAKFDFTLDSTNAKWGQGQDIYRTHPNSTLHGSDVIKSKLRVRGAGNAVLLRFEPEELTGTHLLGWAMVVEETTKE